MNKNNPYIDIDNIDRSQEIENMFTPTLEDIKNDPEFYAELVNDLMFHWMHGTRETELMIMAKKNQINKFESNKRAESFEDFCEFKNGL